MNMNKEKNFVSAVVYLRNSERYVADFLAKVSGTLRENFERYEIICVNDCCEDGTVKRVEDFCRANEISCLSVISTGFFQGVESAMTAGVDMAIGDFVFEFDSPSVDYPASLVMDLYRKSLEGNDIVFAVPQSGSRFMSKRFYSLFNSFSNMGYKIKTHRFSIISRRGINRVRSIGAKTVYRKAIYASCGLPVADIYYSSEGTVAVSSQKSLHWDLAFNSLILFTDIAYKISITLSLLMAFVLLAAGVYTVTVFLSATPVAGWTTTMLVMSGGFFGLFLLFAITMKYLSLILNIVFSPKEYIIEKVDKIVK